MATQTMSSHHANAKAATKEKEHKALGHYSKFAVMVGMSFIAMYVLMYAMVDSISSVYNNVNQIYMAGLMAAPMAIIEIFTMWKMYPKKNLNMFILLGSSIAMILFWFGIRTQTAIGDRQFLRSMIPHHSGAILMCKKAKLSNPQILDLCKNILKSQQEEIDQMKTLLGQK